MATALQGMEARLNHRFRHRTRLALRREGDPVPLTVVTRNVSRGGFFIETNEDVQAGERIELHLLETHLPMALPARVIHAFEETSGGLGVCLEKLPDGAEGFFEAFVRGVEAVSPRDGDPTKRRATAGVAIRARGFLTQYDEGRFYDAVGRSHDDTARELQAAIESLKEAFDAPGEDAGLPRARLALAKVRRTLLDPEHRLAHDLKHGHREVAALIENPPLDERAMRKAWALAFPSKTMQAKELSDAAQRAIREGGVAKACRLGEEALALDPFNRRLRTAVGHWKRRSG